MYIIVIIQITINIYILHKGSILNLAIKKKLWYGRCEVTKIVVQWR